MLGCAILILVSLLFQGRSGCHAVRAGGGWTPAGSSRGGACAWSTATRTSSTGNSTATRGRPSGRTSGKFSYPFPVHCITFRPGEPLLHSLPPSAKSLASFLPPNPFKSVFHRTQKSDATGHSPSATNGGFGEVVMANGGGIGGSGSLER